ncbi:ester cyclase [Nocardioides insulae]|uniref:ester cyclase n=1 Tax=Nocardioides insulae TaxID=394734 RepID=UPI000401C16B|nr:ester cyclase [Nocardioides insulae]
MTVEETRAVARSYFDELTNKQDVDYADRLFTQDIAFHDPAIVPDGVAHGVKEVKGFFSVFFKVFPDVHFHIDDFLAEDDKAAIRFTWTGTHRTEFLGIELKERRVAVPGIDIFHIRDGRIAEVRVAFDRGHLLQQLGGINHPF